MSATTHPAAEGSGTDDYGVRFFGNPLRLAFSASPWRSAAFLFSYLIMSGVLFSVAFTAAVGAAALAFTLIAFPLLIAAANVVHGCAAAERTRLRWVFAQPVRASYQQPATAGLRAQASASWRYRGTWRELAYLTGLWVPLMALDTIVVSVWATFLAGVTLPLWYWAPWEEFGNGQRAHGVQLGFFPNGPNGPAVTASTSTRCLERCSPRPASSSCSCSLTTCSSLRRGCMAGWPGHCCGCPPIRWLRYARSWPAPARLVP